MRRPSPRPARPLLRALLLAATGALAMCGVKGPPRPPEAPQTESPATPPAIATPTPAAGDAGPPP